MGQDFIYLILICILFLFVSLKAINYTVTCDKRVFFSFVALVFCVLVAFRPLGISDAKVYYSRYIIEPAHTSIRAILTDPSFFRGTGYSMSKLVNLMFYVFYKLHVPYQFFALIVVLAELCTYNHYARKILNELRIKYNDYLLFAMFLLFYSFRYQFIAFSQGMAMCFGAPILYYLIKRKNIKALLCVLFSCCFHISALYFFVIMLVYLLTVRMKERTYAVLWVLTGIVVITGLGYKLGDGLTQLAQFALNMIVSSNPIYSAYSEGTGEFVIGISSVLFWLLCGIFIFVYEDNDIYWKLINVNLVSLVFSSIFGRWEIVHRFTDMAKVYIPIIMIIYIYEARAAIILSNKNSKRVTLISVLVLEFAHSIRLLGFV